MQTGTSYIAIFEQARPRLLGLAYRILGSRADAEDAVQDTFIKWQQQNADQIANPAAWLTSACSRRCIDLLRAAYRKRVDYVGTWLPEPIQQGATLEAENAALASSLSTAFLLMLERLSPKERAAYLLHDIFDMPYPEVAAALDITEVACRKLVSRAKRNVELSQARHVTPDRRQRQLLAAFESAITSGSAAGLMPLLADDIRLTADGGGKVSALLHVLHGMQPVSEFLVAKLGLWWRDCQWQQVVINGGHGFIISQNGAISAAISFAYDRQYRLSDVFIMRNPQKLALLTQVAIR
ncbi:RNA polymerase sigma factor SigJ [Serratia odorifera]|uniref:Sigma-70 region 2 n=2 Tax=Serratia odorifera TaxID=618 RepID=D4E6B0_SEROD|nr:RNA polymerase sigma factor SigJ [Serratia odorifera]EFE94839.1 Sigma-70 region 2 [Serratia odorifera DSM 4582]MBJ2064867.1 RNA polymerase sigma factor SigJ [Serratia odorifera]PNK89465.1 RNA polymerase sigma factor SigJ [Serratia odorifera]RII70949.1 sigma-70 family RNA polymerase sigma factor [Serratia odorifera]VDZ63265.1 Probable RNA polymerase sigma factor fecI [Serratia odorifera]